MGMWVPDPVLEPGEQVLLEKAANHTQGRRAVGGQLVITDRALRFKANRVDRISGGHDLDLRREEVRSVGIADRSLEGGPFTGGARRRLEVRTASGPELFVVNGLEELVVAVEGFWGLAG